MKRLIIYTALAATGLAGYASAQSLNTAQTLFQVRQYVPSADLTGLKDSEILLLLDTIHSRRSESYKRTRLKSLLRKGH